MLELLRDLNGLEQHAQVSEILDDNAVVRILFDESHGEILHSQATSELRELLGMNAKYEVLASHLGDGTSLADGVLEECNVDILVLAAPTRPFTTDEVKAVKDFIREGKSLLIANNHDSLRQIEPKQQINQILKSFGLSFQQLVGNRPKKARNLCSHYLSSNVHQLSINNPSCLKKVNNKPQPVVFLPDSEQIFLATVEANPGRIVAVGDFSLFENSKIKQDDNRQLVLNIFCWLAYQNPLDFGVAEIATEIRYGRSELFSITLTNSNYHERLAGLQCSLNSDALAFIEDSEVKVRPISVKEKAEIRWSVQPQKLGFQSLSLKVDFSEKLIGSLTSLPIKIDPIIQFRCVPDAEIRLVVHNHQSDIQEIVETGSSFEIEALTSWEPDAKRVPLHFSLETSSTAFLIEPLTECRWRITALNEGHSVITLRVQETDQAITRLIYAVLSPQFQIAKIEHDILSSLEAKVHHRISQLFPEFNTEIIRQTSFKLVTPEEQVHMLYPRHMQEHLLETLQMARGGHEEFIPLVDELLFYIAPLYSPNYGCCIPYDPKLAAHLIRKYPLRKERIAYNFLWVEGSSCYGKSWLEGNIAALLLHEKYGHGFFYTQTKLGQQLAVLYRHGLLRKVDCEVLKDPYLRSLHEKYGQVIQMLSHSALLLNEGFATWIELIGLQNLSGSFEETVYRRREFLFQDAQLESMVSRSEYFREFDPRPGSKYQIGYEWLRGIQDRFNSNLSLRSVLHAVMKAANVDFGISEQNGRILFALDAEQIKKLLLDKREGYEAGAQTRIGRIWRAVEDWYDRFPDEQAWQNWQRRSLHAESLLNKIVEEELGW